jgi:hypothetical protein
MVETNLLSALGTGPIVKRYIISYKDFTAAATTQNITLQTLPKGSVVQWVRIKHAEAVAGGSISAATLSVGSSAGTATSFASAFSVSQAVSDTTAQISAGPVAATYAEDTMYARITTTGGNVNTATAGLIYVDVCYWHVTVPADKL